MEPAVFVVEKHCQKCGRDFRGNAFTDTPMTVRACDACVVLDEKLARALTHPPKPILGRNWYETKDP